MDLVVRAPNHLGDVVLALPALATARGDIHVEQHLVPVVEMAGLGGEIVPLRRGVGGFVEGARELRRRGYRKGILLTGAFSAAFLCRAGGVRELTGTGSDGRTFMLERAVDPEDFRGRHRSLLYMELVGSPTDEVPDAHPVTVPPGDRERWEGKVRHGPGPVVGVFPGSNASSRRWDADRYREVCRHLARDGFGVVVLGGPGEEALTAHVAGGKPGVADLGGRTDLAGLVAVLGACDLVITNDTGPMHLAGAVGTPTLSLQGAADPTTTRPLGRGHRWIRHPELSCVPCVKNECPRSGRGEILPEAHKECMALITVEEVLETAGELLSGERHPAS